MKPLRFSVVLALLSITLRVLPAQTQTLLPTLNLDANPPAELSKWISGEAQVILTIINPSSSREKVSFKVVMSIKVGGRLVATTNVDKAEVFTMEDVPTKTLFGHEFLKLSTMKFHGNIYNQVLGANRLPPNRYSFCVELQNLGGVSISPEICSDFTIFPPEPPRLHYPETGTKISEPSRERFEWLPTAPESFGTLRYRFRVAEVFKNQSPYSALEGNIPIYEEITSTTSLPWPPSLPPPVLGKIYVWSVQVVKDDGKPLNRKWAAPSTYGGGLEGGGFGEGSLSGELNSFNGELSEEKLLFEYTEGKPKRELVLGRPPILRDTIIRLNAELLDSEERIEGVFFEDTIKFLIEDRQESPFGKTWRGRVEEKEDSYILFVGRNSLVIGNIVLDNALYQVRDAGGGVHRLMQIDLAAIPTDSPKPPPPLSDLTCTTAQNRDVDPADQIDIMVLYTEEAKIGAGGKEEIELETLLSVQETNISFAESGVLFHLNPVHIGQVDYEETGDLETGLDWLSFDGEVAKRREEYAADIVILLAEESSREMSGISYLIPNAHPFYACAAFGVVQRYAATLKNSFGHEVGHIMGSHHDREHNTTGKPFYPFAYGYVNTAKGQQTVMGVSSATRIYRWSNPFRQYDGSPTGVNSGPSTTCNACGLNQRALTVANYRTAEGKIPNVWMKQSWYDNGNDSLHLDSNRYIWNAPSIWLRRRRDTTLTHLYQHQSASEDTNWLYVRTFNSGERSVGRLEVWFSTASLSNVVDSSWSCYYSECHTIPSRIGKIVEIPWTKERRTSGYIFLARWIEEGSDTTEGYLPANLLDYVVENRQVALQNTQVVDLTYPTDAVELSIPFTTLGDATIEIILEELLLTGTSYTSSSAGGNILLDFGNQLFTEVEGAERLQSGVYRLTDSSSARFSFCSDARGSGTILLRFERPMRSPYGLYAVRFLQRGKDRRITGGITYLLKVLDHFQWSERDE
ncbi:MAG: hypothetical protein KDD67_16215 [Ignavibacteriae bacterium]|nr:hypothetical protein [Ignavibacteriota bacterium]MCB9216827.1 hypothetical protein [Ignavibacteria bacterium]